ncbi:MAG: hypothetical protein K0V04_07540, partial [Deltaproteobacteria bacterium]|nr:hypothetical protein [Deltaproteobacteria bacterium]
DTARQYATMRVTDHRAPRIVDHSTSSPLGLDVNHDDLPRGYASGRGTRGQARHRSDRSRLKLGRSEVAF